MSNPLHIGKRPRRGAVLVLMVILLPVFLMLAAFAINLAYMELNRTELYTATDAAARATGREFSMTRDKAAARAKGKLFAEKNLVAGTPLRLQYSDFDFGESSRPNLTSTYQFDSHSHHTNSVKVIGRRDASSADGPIPLLMPNLLGRSNFSTQQSAISTSVEVDIALVLDRSGSMAYAAHEVAAFPPSPYSAPADWNFCDPAPPDCRWRNLITAVGVFLNEVSQSPADEAVSVSTYSDVAITNCDLTHNYGDIINSLNPYTQSYCAGATNIGGGINEGVGALTLSPQARPNAMKVIILMTDGIHNVGDYPLWPAEVAANMGVQIFTITFANEADQWLMQEVASRGGGVHFHASSPADLSLAFQEIAKRLPTLLTK